MERKNDWIAALINRPDFTMVDMYANDIKPENTGLQDKDYYKDIPQVREKFTTDNGQFDEQAYGEFYDSALRMYNAYTDGDFLDKMIDSIERSPFDWTKIDNPNVHDVSAVLSASHDPYRHSMGLKNFYDIGDPQFSIKEVAQANFVRDENGNKLDWTPNDKGGLIKGLFRPTVFLAQYDEDTVETDQYGNTIVHKAGDYKFDDEGDPFYEVLGNRDPYGKQILNYSDTFTVEGTKLNKWDPFDSDGITKSIGSTIAKTALKLTPFLFGPTVGAVAGTAYAAFGLASVFPVLGKMINGIVSSNDNQLGRSLTKWESYMERFAPAKSEAGSNSFWNFENIADIIATSASQLYSQRQIANIPKWLSKGAETRRNSKIGQQIALAYMATTSAQDTYSAYIEAGANEELAGIASLATMGAFYGLMSQDYWKNHMFGGSWLDENATMYRRTADEWIKNQAGKLTELNPNPTPTKWYKTVYDKVTDFLKNNETLNKAKTKATALTKKSGKTAKETTEQTIKQSTKRSFLASSSDYLRTGLNEGLEETMEEATTDLIKGLSMGLEALGMDLTEDEGKLDFGFSAQDFLSRYTSAFVGGTIGGMVFEGLKKKDSLFGPKTVSLLDRSTGERLIWLELNGYGNQLRKYIEKQYRKGNLGNENLSSQKADQNDPNSPFKPGTKEDNQNLLMRNILLSTLDEIEYDINNFAGTLVYSDLYKTAVEESEERAKKEGLSLEEYEQKYKISPFVNTLLGMGVADNIMDDFVDITHKIVDLNTKIKEAEDEEASKTVDSDPNHSTSNQYIRDLIKQRDELVKQAKDIKEGKNLDEYLEQVFFYVSPELANFYLSPNFQDDPNSEVQQSYIHSNVEAYTKWKYDLDYNSLSEKIKEQLKDEYNNFYNLSVRHRKVRAAQRIHSRASKQFKPIIESLNTELRGYKKNSFFGGITYGEFAQSGIDEILNNNKKIEAQLKKIEIENPDYLTDPEWTGLNAELQENNTRFSKLNEIKNSILAKVRLDEFIPQSLSSEEQQDGTILTTITEQSKDAESRTNANPLTKSERVALVSSVKDYYQYLLNNKIVNSDEDPLNNALKIVFSGTQTSLDNLKNLNIQEATSEFVQNSADLDQEQLKILWELDPYKNAETFEEEIDNDPTYFPNQTWDEVVNQLPLDQVSQLFGDNALFVEYARAENKSQTRLGKLIPQLDLLASTLQNNTFAFKKKYDELVTKLPELGITQEQLDNIITQHLFAGDKQLYAETLDLIQARNATKLPTAYNLIKNIELQIKGQNSALWDVLQREEQELYSKKSIQDYITDDFSRDAFKYGLQIVNLVIPQITAAVNGGFNSQLNEEKAKLGKELLPIVDNNSAEIVLTELEHIASKLRFLLHLANTNQDSQWREQQDAAIHMEPMFVDKLLKYGDHLKLTANDDEKEKNWLQDIWDKVNQDVQVDLTKVTDENYKDFYKVKVAFESEVYARVNQSKETRQEFKNILIDWFGSSESLGMGHSEYSKTLESDRLKSWDILEYLEAIAFTDTNKFLSIYKSVIKDQNNKYVPFTGQEFIVRQMYSHVLNQTDYREILNGINEKFKERPEVKGDAYLLNRSVLDNFLFVDGNSAVGKSSAISFTLKKVLEAEFGNEVQFRGVARFKERFQNLKDNLELQSEGEVKRLEDLIKEIWPSNNGVLDVNDENLFDVGKNGTINNAHRLKITKEFNTNPDKFFTGNGYKVLVFDEVTLANEADLQILNKYAQLNGIFIIGLGNKKQNTWQTPIKAYNKDGSQISGDVRSNSGIEDCIVSSTPILKASLRTQNEGKRRNKNAVEAIVTSLWDQLDKNPSLSLEDIEYNKNDYPITLLSYEDEINGKHEYYGDKIVIDDSILTNLATLEGTKLIITDDPGKYEAYKAQGFTILGPNEAQGEEADYVFIDHDFSSKKTINRAESPLLFYRDFYTMITRAKQASFIKIQNGEESVLSKYNIDQSNDQAARAKISSVINNQEVLDKFRAWRLSLLEDVEEIIPKSTTQTEVTTTSVRTTSEPEPTKQPSPIILSPEPVASTTLASDKEHWINAVEKKLIRNDNAEDYLRRRDLKDQVIHIDLNDFIDKVNQTKSFDKYNTLKKLDSDFNDETYRTFISYLSLGVSRFFYDYKRSDPRFLPEFNGKYLDKYITQVNDKIPEEIRNSIITAINQVLNNKNSKFIVYNDEVSGSQDSTVFIPIEIDEKQFVLPIFQINTKLNGLITRDVLIAHFNPDNAVKSIAVSSSGNTFIPLVQVAKNKAFLLNDTYLFKPNWDVATDLNNAMFRRRNAGTSNKLLLDVPISSGEDATLAKAYFSTEIDDNKVITSYVNTKDGRLIRTNIRARDFKVFFDLAKAKFVAERGYELDGMSYTDAENILYGQFGDIINQLQFTHSANQKENAENSKQNNLLRKGSYRILNNNSLNSVTSALLYWFNSSWNDQTEEAKKIRDTWGQLLMSYIQSDISPEYDSGFKYQNGIFFGFRTANGTYSNYVFRRKQGDNNTTTYEFTTENPKIVIDTFTTDKQLTELSPKQLFELFIKKYQEHNGELQAYSKTDEQLVQFNPENLEEYLQNGSLVFGLYKRGIKNQGSTSTEKGEQEVDTYFLPYDTDLLEIFFDGNNTSQELINSFSEIGKSFKPFQYGVFLNVASNNVLSNEERNQYWFRVNSNDDDKFVTDIVDIIAPFYGIDNFDNGQISQASTNTELQWIELITGKQQLARPETNSDEVLINDDIKYNIVTGGFNRLSGEKLNFIGKIDRDDHFDYYFTDNSSNQLYAIHISKQSDEKISNNLIKSHPRQNFIAYTEGEGLSNGVVYEEDGKYNYYETNSNLTVDPGTSPIEVKLININGANQFKNLNGEIIPDLVIVAQFDPEIESDFGNFYYYTGTKYKFDSPLRVSKTFLEKYTPTSLNNTNEEYISIDSISNNNIITTSDDKQIILKDAQTFLNGVTDKSGIKNNEQALVDKVSKYTSDSKILSELRNQSKNVNLDDVNLILSDAAYELGALLKLDEDWNISTQISDDITANYLARKLSLKSQIKSVSLEQNDRTNKRIRVILNDDSIKTYQFKTNDPNFKDSQYYKSTWNYQEVNNSEESSSFTNDTLSALKRDLNDDELFNIGDLQDVRTYLNLLIDKSPTARRFRNNVKNLMLEYRNGTSEQQAIYQKYDEYMRRIREINDSNNKQC